MIRSRPLLLVVLATLAALLAGCGSADRVEYERELAKVGRMVDRSLAQLPGDEAETVDQADVRRIADDLREAAAQLDDIDPPEDAAEAHEQLARGMRGVANAFDELADDLDAATTDVETAEVFVRFTGSAEVDEAFDDLVAAQEALAAEGYRVFDAPEAPAARGAAPDGG